MTGLAIVVSGVWSLGETGAVLSTQSFEAAMPGIGKYVLAIGLSVFAFTTILGWAYYGEKCWTYLVGRVCEKPFHIFWTLSAFVGVVAMLDFAWLVADTLDGGSQSDLAAAVFARDRATHTRELCTQGGRSMNLF